MTLGSKDIADADFSIIARILSPDFASGKLFWLPRTPDLFSEGRHTAKHACAVWNSRYAHQEAFTCVEANGYRTGLIFRRAYKAHRVLWLLHKGCWPSAEIDHINGDRGDNRLVNLREVSHAENGKNQRIARNNTSGVQGVYWHRTSRKWRAKIKVDGRTLSLGGFNDFDSAAAARRAANLKFGFHETHGKAGA